MPTKVFICWSGTRSRQFAESVKVWLPTVLGETLSVSISTQIEKGAEWFEELQTALSRSDCGILCLTPEAIASPWIHFEAGLLVRELSEEAHPDLSSEKPRRVFPLLHGVDGSDLKGPLAAYQSTSATDIDDVLRLLESIHQFMPDGERPQKGLLGRRCARQWEGFQAALTSIPRVSLREVLPDFEQLFRRKTFQESMYDCLSQVWLDRYNGARDTQTKLRAHQDTVRKACRGYVADVFDELVTELDSYAMGLSMLLGAEKFPIDNETGRVGFGSPGLALACERHRKLIRVLVARLTDETQAPVWDEAFRFDKAETFEERKRLIHRKKAEIDQPDLTQVSPKLDQSAESDWDFDRILFYEYRAEQNDISLPDEIPRARRELERANARSEGVSLMPLHYALGPIEKAAGRSVEPGAAALRTLCEDIRVFIERSKTDSGGQVRATLARIEAFLQRAVEPAAM